MKSAFLRYLAVAGLLGWSGPMALSQTPPETQVNFSLSPHPTVPGSYRLSAPGVNGRVYFFQISTDQQNWAYANTVKLGSTGTPLEYGFTPVSGQQTHFRLKYTVETNHTAGATGDLDGDGLTNVAELAALTDPSNPDSHGDGMPDGWEVIYGFNPLSAADADFDSEASGPDGLTNVMEYLLGSHPGNPDTDADGAPDGEEYLEGTDPTEDTSAPVKLCYLVATVGWAMNYLPPENPESWDLPYSIWWETNYSTRNRHGYTFRAAGMGGPIYDNLMPLSAQAGQLVAPEFTVWNIPQGPPSDPIAISSAYFRPDGEGGAHSEKIQVWLRGPKSAAPLTRHYLKKTRKEILAPPYDAPVEETELISFTVPEGANKSDGQTFSAALSNTLPRREYAEYTSIAFSLLPFEVVTDHDRDGRLDTADARPGTFLEQGAYNSSGVFQPKGAIVWANLDYDEERIGGGGKPVADTIRFWHNGLDFESSDEDFTIRNGERTIVPYLTGYVAPPAGEIRSFCPDIAPVKLSRLDSLPSGYKVLLRVARAEDVRAFHFYKRIPDFSQSDPEEKAIWGSFKTSGSPNPEWSSQDHVVDNQTIDLTKWVNEGAANYAGFQATRRAAEDPFVFGIEAMLYKGMKYDIESASFYSTFDGSVDFTLILKNDQGVESEISKFRMTFLRLPAFPGAQGFGKWSQGGRGGEVYKVTSLSDSGPGSLGEGISTLSRTPLDPPNTPVNALNFPGTERKIPRTIVFEVGGRITLGQTKPLNVARGLLTIAGQTASGQGIALTDASFRVSGAESAVGKAINRPNDVVLRYMRVRRATSVPPGRDPNSSDPQAGYPMGPDTFMIKSASRVIVDHCSFNGGIDGTMEIVQADATENEQPEMDVTAQWCYIHHTLKYHSKASLLKGKYGARYSVIKCYYGHNQERNPQAAWLQKGTGPLTLEATGKRLLLEFSDNIVYIWQNNQEVAGTTTPESSGIHLQFRANHYKRGLDTGAGYAGFELLNGGERLHCRNNRMDGSLWNSDYQYVDNAASASPIPWSFITDYGSLGDANTARDRIVAHGGSSRGRDVADTAYAAEVNSGIQGMKYQVSATIPAALVPSYPISGPLSGYIDSDNDGMDDRWENKYRPQSVPLASLLPWQDLDGDGWTNLEEYLNKTDPTVGNDPLAGVESNIEDELFTP